MLRKPTLLGALVGVLALPLIAEAEDPPPAEPTPVEPEAPTEPASLPPPQSDKDPRPPVAEPLAEPSLPPPGGLVSQAGVGGPIGYGRAGVLELGGSAGLTIATDMRNINIAPQIGWFVVDNLQLSGIVNLAYIDTADSDGNTMFSALAEPSYHMPFNRSVFGFLGIGVGGAYITGVGGGFAVAPRIGANVMVGRSGILTPSLSWQYMSNDVDAGASGSPAVLAVSSALRANIGYTVMW